jgi:hypothetical protein
VFKIHAGNAPATTVDAARKRVGEGLRARDLNKPDVFAALALVSGDICKIACNIDPLRVDFRVQFRPL